MIDLCSHILDGTPCGPASFDDSLAMCRAAVADGVRMVVATPRWEADREQPPLPLDECRRKVARLGSEMGGMLSVKLGFVLQFGPDLPRLVALHGESLALAGRRHLLVSLPSIEIPADAEAVWLSLRRAGFSVVLAHPECNAKLRRDPDRLAQWVHEGVMLQVDAASVLGKHGREVQRFALNSLHKFQGRVAVASNMNWDADGRHSLRAAREELSRKMGARRAKSLTAETPAAFLGDAAGHNGVSVSSRRGFASALRSSGLFRALTGES